MGQNLPESTTAGLNFRETELTLGLPGGGDRRPIRTSAKSGIKRVFLETKTTKSGTTSLKRGGVGAVDRPENETGGVAKSSAAKEQVVGWPPIRASRRNVTKSSKYVKVAVDGAPYLRKVDLETYGSYEQLLRALENLFSCFSICECVDGWKIMDHVNGVEYVPTYEDREGDWMLVGDVPWKMFVESCKRLRLMKSSEAIGLASRTPSNCSGSCC